MAKKIDVHVHVGEDLYRRYTPEMALERMDRNDIEFAVISPVPDYPTPYGIKSSAQQNDYIAAALQKYPDLLSPHGCSAFKARYIRTCQ